MAERVRSYMHFGEGAAQSHSEWDVRAKLEARGQT